MLLKRAIKIIMLFQLNFVPELNDMIVTYFSII